jgi:hypothetical protein
MLKFGRCDAGRSSKEFGEMSESVRERTGRHGTVVVQEAFVREELERILGSSEFSASKRCQEFLRYVVDKTLAGHADDLKERTIGVELLGRPSSYEPSTDASVRVKAGEVRKRLHLYYNGPGLHDRLRIEMPAGGYVPDFLLVPTPVETLPTPEAVPARTRSRTRWVVAGIIVILLGVVLGVPRWQAQSQVLQRFWAPALSDDSPVLLCISPVPVYGLHPDVEAGIRKATGPEDFISLPGNFVGRGDVLALGRLTAMFGEMGHKYRIRLGNEVSFHDLKDSPLVLIGYSYTKWNELNRGLRFLIDTTHRPPAITDDGKLTEWVLPTQKPDRSTDEDYAIITRLLHPDTGELLVSMAGITQYGSEAASDLVTDAGRLQQVLEALPAGWEKRNLQLVLRVRVISGAPGSSTVVATHVW